MNRFIQLSRKQPSVPFQVAIYRDNRTWSGYAAVCIGGLGSTSRPRPVAQEQTFNDVSIRKLNG